MRLNGKNRRGYGGSRGAGGKLSSCGGGDTEAGGENSRWSIVPELSTAPSAASLRLEDRLRDVKSLKSRTALGRRRTEGCRLNETFSGWA